MRPRRLLLVPLAALVSLAAAGPATAADWGVAVTPDFTFAPPEQDIAVGDTVTWTWNDGGHTTTSVGGQPDSWDSGLKQQGATFQHTFARPGRYQYICKPHRAFMKGTIVVGQDAVADTLDAFKTRRRGTSVTISFKLNEAAAMTYELKGRTRKTVERKRLAAGRHSFKLRRLKPGRYRGTLTLVDDFDHKTTAKKSFVVR